MGVQLANGRYELQGVLGRGGMATVWRAYDRRLDVHRAVKVLNPDFAGRPKLRSRFRDEAQLMAKLHHNHITTVHDVVEDGDTVYIVMELVDGGSLIDRVRKLGPLTPRQASEVMQAVLAALQLSHKRGIVHRDIKPHNILLTSDGTAKVTDFGIAQIAGADTRTRTGATMGTLQYMPPEQRLDAKRVDQRADIYSCGVTLYTLVNGTEPTEDLYIAEPGGLVYGILPPQLAEIVRMATRYRLEDRYPSAEDMRLALKAVHHELDDIAGVPLGVPMPDEESGSWGPTLEPPMSNPPAETFGFEQVVVEPETPAPIRSVESPEVVTAETDAPASPSEPEAVSVPAPEASSSNRWVVAAGVLLLLGIGGAWFFQGGEPVGAEVADISVPDVAEERPAEERPEDVVVDAAAAAAPEEPEPVVEAAVEAVVEEPAPRPVVVAATPEPVVREPVVVREPEPTPAVTEPGPATTEGRLMVNSLPWSNVSVDGSDKGVTDWSGPMASGRHNLVLRTGDGREKRVTVEVPADDILRYCWDFEQGAQCSR